MKDTLYRFAVVIPAAGYSSRMGRFKPLLPIDGMTVIERLISLFRDSGIEDIVVVTGYQSNALAPILQRMQVQRVENPNFNDGMFSSIRAGIHLVKPGVSAVFLMPADIPLVRRMTIHRLLSTFRNHPKSIIHPCFQGKRGHPPLIPADLIAPILGWQNDGGMKSFLDAYEHRSIEIEVPDRYILTDMDFPDDYAMILTDGRNHDIPSREECDVILTSIHPVSEGIRRHSNKVADVACRIGHLLISEGVDLNLDLLLAGAILHDIAKGQKDHAIVGGRILHEMGFDRVGDIVAMHTDLDVGDADEISEAEVVYLADKYVKDDHLISLDERFDNALKRYSNREEAKQNIMLRRRHAFKVKERLERILGEQFRMNAS